MKKISLLCFFCSLLAFALALKGCADVLKTLAYTSTEMGIESKIGWYACVPLFILAVIFSAFAPKTKNTDTVVITQNSIEEEWERIEEESKKTNATEQDDRE